MKVQPSIHLRFDSEDQRAALATEAKADNRSLNNYVLHLLATHPSRPKQKPKARR